MWWRPINNRAVKVKATQTFQCNVWLMRREKASEISIMWQIEPVASTAAVSSTNRFSARRKRDKVGNMLWSSHQQPRQQNYCRVIQWRGSELTVLDYIRCMWMFNWAALKWWWALSPDNSLLVAKNINKDRNTSYQLVCSIYHRCRVSFNSGGGRIVGTVSP